MVLIGTAAIIRPEFNARGDNVSVNVVAESLASRRNPSAGAWGLVQAKFLSLFAGFWKMLWRKDLPSPWIRRLI